MPEKRKAELPECLNRRYKALDELISELNVIANGSQAESLDPGVKLMCNFWKILKEDPSCDLTAEVHNCFPPSEKSSYLSFFTDNQHISFGHPQRMACYMANNQENESDQSHKTPNTNACNVTPDSQSCNQQPHQQPQTPQTPQTPPLSKVLTNLKQAASFDNSCNVKLKELLAAEKHLRNQIARLEAKEKEGVKLMKEADKMWSGMEDAYKEKIAESLERQNELIAQLQDIENSAAKWRKNKRDLEAQLESINQCQMDMIAKINQKNNDLKTIDTEILAHKKRVEQSKIEAETIKKSMGNKKLASDGRLAKIAQEITRLEKELREESKQKADKERTGKGYISEAREELQKVCKVLMQRKLELEDLQAEKSALIEEINILKDTCDNCKDRCSTKQKNLVEELKKIDIEIANYKLKCIRCNQCVDTIDIRMFCTDCPRCIEHRECLVGDATCTVDPGEDCICLKVKKTFLNNVFENMSIVLARKIDTSAGKAVGTEVLNCLKRSRNGKLNDYTKKLLQEFVLQTIKKNLNLTVVGGAVKTRCEMDAETYKQLLLCIKNIKATPPPKKDQGIDVKKDPCTRFGGECNCPKGPKDCICTKKAPPPLHDPATCPPEPPPPDPGEVIVCPHKSKPCGPDCGAYAPDRVGADVAKFRPDPCAGPSCPFGMNMRAAQCVLGPEPLKLSSPDQLHFGTRGNTLRGMGRTSGLSNLTILQDKEHCECCDMPSRLYPSKKDEIIEEVLGGYLDVDYIEKVANISEDGHSNSIRMEINEDRVRSNNISTVNFVTDIGVNKLTSLKDEKNKQKLENTFYKDLCNVALSFSSCDLVKGEIRKSSILSFDYASGYLSAKSSKNMTPHPYKSDTSIQQGKCYCKLFEYKKSTSHNVTKAFAKQMRIKSAQSTKTASKLKKMRKYHELEYY